MIFTSMRANYSKYKYVSFDIFDTLICRSLMRPSDVFELVEKKANEIFQESAITGFSVIRINSEILARKKKNFEITIEDIYDEIESLTKSKWIDKYKSLEIEIEKEIVYPNLSVKTIYDTCINKGIKVIITSDMYLPRTVIEYMLKKCGYEGYERLFLSSEMGFRKNDGSLFNYIREQLQIPSWQMIHLGDNFKSDYLMAIRNGVCSKHIHNLDITKKLGHNVFGPFLFGFLNWLHSNFTREGYDRVFFLSRDGFFMKEAYEALFGLQAVKCEYLYLSRRLLQVATLWMHPDLEAVCSNMYMPMFFSYEWFAESVGYNEPLKIEESVLCRDHVLDNKSFISFYEEIKKDLILNSKKEYESLKGHLNSIGFKGKVAIVDVGWIGNMQKLLTRTANEMELPIDITGYYVGVNPLSPNATEQKMRGYLFDNTNNKDLYYKERFIDNIFELFFIAPHGSAKCYERDETGNYRIVLSDNEYKGTKTIDIFRDIQKNALGFCIMHKYDEERYCDYTNLIDTFVNPSLKVAKIFGSIDYWNKKMIKLSNFKGLFYYLFHPICLKEDFINSPWKPGFLKRLFIIPINYGKLLAWVYKRTL